MPTIPNLELITWDSKSYLIPLDMLDPKDRMAICTRGRSDFPRGGSPRPIRWFRAALGREGVTSAIWEDNVRLAHEANIKAPGIQDYDAFMSFKKAVLANKEHMVRYTSHIRTDSTASDEVLTRTDAALTLIWKYVSETSDPASPEQEKLCSEFELLASVAAARVVESDSERSELEKLIAETRGGLSSIRNADSEYLTSDTDREKLINETQITLSLCENKRKDLMNEVKASLKAVKDASEALNREYEKFMKRSTMEAKVAALEEVNRKARDR